MNIAIWILSALLIITISISFIKTRKAKKPLKSKQYRYPKPIYPYLRLDPKTFLEDVEQEIEYALEQFIDQHASVLLRKRNQLTMVDDYGTKNEIKWHNEVRYFVDQVMIPSIPDILSPVHSRVTNYLKLHKYISQEDKRSLTSMETSDLFQVVNRYLDNFATNSRSTMSLSEVDNLDPYEFEGYCAQLLNYAGFDANVTQGSGDQGVDVVARKSGNKYVFQCKLYSKPIGNKAVQEIIAGKQFEGADFAAVVSNQSYTPAAKALAASAQVLLLHHTELENIDKVQFY